MADGPADGANPSNQRFSLQPLDALRPLEYSELQPGYVHLGRYIVVKVVQHVLLQLDKVAGIAERLVRVEGQDGSVMLASVCGLQSSASQEQAACTLPPGSVLAVKEPYFRNPFFKGLRVLRVDRPTDLVWLSRGAAPPQLALSPLRPASPSSQQQQGRPSSPLALKQLGNTLYKDRSFVDALHVYQAALDMLPQVPSEDPQGSTSAAAPPDDTAKLRLDLCNNCALACLGLGTAEAAGVAAAYARAALRAAGLAGNAKARGSEGKALLVMERYSEAAAALRALLDLHPEFAERAKFERLLARAQLRAAEQEQGEFDVADMLRRSSGARGGNDQPFVRLDNADYVGPVHVAILPGKGRGLVATRDVQPGELLLADKAVSIAVPGEAREEFAHLQDAQHPYEHARVAMLKRTATQVLGGGDVARSLVQLSCGSTGLLAGGDGCPGLGPQGAHSSTTATATAPEAGPAAAATAAAATTAAAASSQLPPAASSSAGGGEAGDGEEEGAVGLSLRDLFGVHIVPDLATQPYGGLNPGARTAWMRRHPGLYDFSPEGYVSVKTGVIATVLANNAFCPAGHGMEVAPTEFNGVTRGLTASGLYAMASLTNHACAGNATRAFVGDFMFVRAGRAIQRGEEVCFTYVYPVRPLDGRTESLRSYGIDACDCALCEDQRALRRTDPAKAEVLHQVQKQFASMDRAIHQRNATSVVSKLSALLAKAERTLEGRAFATELHDVALDLASVHKALGNRAAAATAYETHFRSLHGQGASRDVVLSHYSAMEAAMWRASQTKDKAEAWQWVAKAADLWGGCYGERSLEAFAECARALAPSFASGLAFEPVDQLRGQLISQRQQTASST